MVQVRVAPASWTWTDSFPFMTGWPFAEMKVLEARFVFSSEPGRYPWGDASGAVVAGGPVQNLASKLVLPESIQAVIPLFTGLAQPCRRPSTWGSSSSRGSPSPATPRER